MGLSENELMTMDGILGFRIDKLAKGLMALVYCRSVKDHLTPDDYEYEHLSLEEKEKERAEMMTEDGGWNDYNTMVTDSYYCTEYLIDFTEILIDYRAWLENNCYLNEEDVKRMCKEFNVNYEDFSKHRQKLLKLDREREEALAKASKSEFDKDNLFD
ncbi:hypothetical protein ACYATO_08775 [Lactobacillaceae bacterium Melli_B3]